MLCSGREWSDDVDSALTWSAVCLWKIGMRLLKLWSVQVISKKYLAFGLHFIQMTCKWETKAHSMHSSLQSPERTGTIYKLNYTYCTVYHYYYRYYIFFSLFLKQLRGHWVKFKHFKGRWRERFLLCLFLHFMSWLWSVCPALPYIFCCRHAAGQRDPYLYFWGCGGSQRDGHSSEVYIR